MESTVLVVDEKDWNLGGSSSLIEVYKNKIQKLVGRNKFKNVSLWSYSSAAGGFHFIDHLWLFKKKYIIEKILVDDQDFLRCVLEGFVNRPSKKNPGLLKFYLSKSLEGTTLEQRIVENVIFDIEYFADSSSLDSLLSFVTDKELLVLRISDMGEFSLLFNPELLLCENFRIRNLDRDIDLVDISDSTIKGYACSKERQRVTLVDSQGVIWELQCQDGVASLNNASSLPEDDLISSLKGSDTFYPKLLSNPKNQVAHQLFNVIQMVNTTKEIDENLKATLTILLESFVSTASQNDATLFPKLADRPELRARAVSYLIKELKRIPINNQSLKTIIDSKLSKFDFHRVNSKHEVKKAKLDIKTMNETASAVSEFRLMVPHLDMTYPQQREGPPNAPKSNSLLSLYWRVKKGIIDEPRLKGKKFWE